MQFPFSAGRVRPTTRTPKPLVLSAAVAALFAAASAPSLAQDANALTARFSDGFTLESADKQHSISLSGRVQADYRAFSLDSTNANAANTFDARRAYLGVSGRLYRDWTFDVTGNFVQSGAALDVGWINYGGFRPAQIRFGQFKMPFSLEEQTSSRFIDFTERSLANALVPAKERGIMVHGAPVTGFSYALALSNGQGNNANEPDASVDEPDVIGRVTANIAEVIGRKNAIIHLGLGYSTGRLPPETAAPSGRTEGRGVTFFSSAATTGEMDRERTGLELALALNQFKLQAEWIKADFSGTSDAGVGFDRAIEATYVSFGWLITGENYADAYRGGAFRAIRPRQAFGAGGWGALELGLRYTDFDAGDFLTTHAEGTGVLAGSATNKADAVTIGLKWIPNTNTRVYLNFVETRFDSPVAVAGGTDSRERALNLRVGVYF